MAIKINKAGQPPVAAPGAAMVPPIPDTAFAATGDLAAALDKLDKPLEQGEAPTSKPAVYGVDGAMKWAGATTPGPGGGGGGMVSLGTVLGHILTKHPDGSEDSQDVVVAKKPVAHPFCTVSVAQGYTKNLGNYQSARVDVRIDIPCSHGEIDEVFEYAQTWVDAKLLTLVESLGAES